MAESPLSEERICEKMGCYEKSRQDGMFIAICRKKFGKPRRGDMGYSFEEKTVFSCRPTGASVFLSIRAINMPSLPGLFQKLRFSKCILIRDIAAEIIIVHHNHQDNQRFRQCKKREK
ncbi:MAG: hypothetical protein GY795_18965 [Desulfobacterales bacterium]|nr:hypothetical protein [Desulfobacterales bacterium]